MCVRAFGLTILYLFCEGRYTNIFLTHDPFSPCEPSLPGSPCLPSSPAGPGTPLSPRGPCGPRVPLDPGDPDSPFFKIKFRTVILEIVHR